MAKLTEVVISRSAKINTGNYESTDVFCSFKAELESVDLDEFTEDDIADLRKRVREAVLDEVVHVVYEKGMGVKDGKSPSRTAIAKRWGLT